MNREILRYFIGMVRLLALSVVLLAVGCGTPSTTLPAPKQADAASKSGNAGAVAASPSKVPIDTQAMVAQPKLGKSASENRAPGSGSHPEASASIASVQKTAPQMSAQNKVTEEDLGVPFYPSSTAFPAGDLTATGPKGTTVTSTRVTEDSPIKVLDFYKSKLGEPVASNRKTPEPLEVWRVGDQSMIAVSTQLVNGQTKVIVTVSPVVK